MLDEFFVYLQSFTPGQMGLAGWEVIGEGIINVFE